MKLWKLEMVLTVFPQNQVLFEKPSYFPIQQNFPVKRLSKTDLSSTITMISIRPNGSIVMKFHSEPHTNSKEHQTSTEPFHLHVKKDEQDLEASLRLPNGRIRNYGL